MLAQDERFALPFKARTYCLLPQGFTLRSLSTMNHPAYRPSKRGQSPFRKGDCPLLVTYRPSKTADHFVLISRK